MTTRCKWPGDDPLMIDYHDKEWGVPVRDDQRLFEFLVLEGAQAGLSWATILKKRDAYRRLFGDFDPRIVASFDARKIEGLLGDERIVRNRLKIEAAIENARIVLSIKQEYGSFAEYIWQFVDGRPIRNGWKKASEIPSQTRESEKMSRDLKKRGFRFVGPTICYAFMQAVGMVNDHIVACYRYEELTER